MAEPEHVRVQPENGEYMIKLTKYDFIYHAHVKVGDADPALLQRQQTAVVAFLVRKMLDDLRAPGKIFVFRQNEPLLASDLVDLRQSLARYGRSTLLWIQEARPGHPPGTVDTIDPTLMTGYVRRLALRDSVPDLDAESWLVTLRHAYALWSASQTDVPDILAMTVPGPVMEAPRLDVAFGVDGNAAAAMGYGWSAPEDGFTWAIDDTSLLTLGELPHADDYWLEMDVVPYEVLPGLPAQHLDIAVNGEIVRSYDKLDRGRVACSVPGRLISGRSAIEIRLDHPNASSPSLMAREGDDRRLAIAFRSLSISCVMPPPSQRPAVPDIPVWGIPVWGMPV